MALRTPTPGTILSFPVYARLSHDAAAHDSVLLAIAAVRDCVIRNDEPTCKKAAIALMAMDLQWNSRKKMSVAKLATVVKTLRGCRVGDGSGLAALMVDLRGQINLKEKIPKFIESLATSDEFKTSCARILDDRFTSSPPLVCSRIRQNAGVLPRILANAATGHWRGTCETVIWRTNRWLLIPLSPKMATRSCSMICVPTVRQRVGGVQSPKAER